jgi:hypothetical protein
MAAKVRHNVTEKELAAKVGVKVKVVEASARVEANNKGPAAVRAPTKVEANDRVAAKAAVRDRGHTVKYRTKGARAGHEGSLAIATIG